MLASALKKITYFHSLTEETLLIAKHEFNVLEIAQTIPFSCDLWSVFVCIHVTSGKYFALCIWTLIEAGDTLDTVNFDKADLQEKCGILADDQVLFEGAEVAHLFRFDKFNWKWFVWIKLICNWIRFQKCLFFSLFNKMSYSSDSLVATLPWPGDKNQDQFQPAYRRVCCVRGFPYRRLRDK